MRTPLRLRRFSLLLLPALLASVLSIAACGDDDDEDPGLDVDDSATDELGNDETADETAPESTADAAPEPEDADDEADSNNSAADAENETRAQAACPEDADNCIVEFIEIANGTEGTEPMALCVTGEDDWEFIDAAQLQEGDECGDGGEVTAIVTPDPNAINGIGAASGDDEDEGADDAGDDDATSTGGLGSGNSGD